MSTASFRVHTDRRIEVGTSGVSPGNNMGRSRYGSCRSFGDNMRVHHAAVNGRVTRDLAAQI
jgi:hypothetical protein